MDVHDVAMEDSPHMFVRNLASRQNQKVSHTMIEHVHPNGDRTTIELESSPFPIDLALYASKEELLNSRGVRQAHRSGIIEFVPYKHALDELRTPEARADLDMRNAKRAGKRRAVQTDDRLTDVQRREMQRGLQPQLEVPAKGDATSDETRGVNIAVVNVMEDRDLSNSHRLAALRNLVDIMSDADKRYIRNLTEDAEIRKIVA